MDSSDTLQKTHNNDNYKLAETKYSYKFLLREITDSTATCVSFLQEHSVIEKSKTCPGPKGNGNIRIGCGQPMILKETKDRTDKLLWRCRRTHKFKKNGKNFCAKDIKLSIRDSTWLSDVKLPLPIAIELIYLWSNGYTNCEINSELKLSHKTIVEWTYYFREAVTSYMMDISEPIGGNGVEVEIDESKFGKRKYHKGHPVEGQWVFGGREKYDKSKIFMISVHDRKAKTLIPIIKKWIKPGSIIHSDCWRSYTSLPSHGYTHVTVNHSKEFKNASNAACTNAIESEWRHAKVFMPSYGVHNGLHDSYLGEFMWRRRFHNEDKFPCLLKILNETFSKKYMTSTP